MGYTPRSLFKMIRGYVDLVEGRRKIIETNTRLTEENRVLKERLDAKG
jgi:regulator of replication initiation timing